MNHLSQLGRATLIKATTDAIPSYMMANFRFPTLIIDNRESISNNYFGVGKGLTRGFPLIDNESLSRAKCEVVWAIGPVNVTTYLSSLWKNGYF